MAEESFSQAFARARREGKETFMWKGKTYGTKLKGENDSSNRGGGKTSLLKTITNLSCLSYRKSLSPYMGIICLQICLIALT